MTKKGAVMGPPVELYQGPAQRRDPREDRDVRRPEVRERLLADARGGRYLYWWLGFP